jgi:hypothetical protein
VLRELGIDAPVAHRVGVGQGVAGNRAAETQMVELGGLRAKTGFDVAQALEPSELRERQTQILVEAGEPFDPILTSIAGNATTKCRQRQMLHHLGKYVVAFVHWEHPCAGGVARSARSRVSCEIETT